MNNFRITHWLACIATMGVLGIQSSSAQTVEADQFGFIIGEPEDLVPAAVSYTHLTLPTILLV